MYVQEHSCSNFFWSEIVVLFLCSKLPLILVFKATPCFSLCSIIPTTKKTLLMVQYGVCGHLGHVHFSVLTYPLKDTCSLMVKIFLQIFNYICTKNVFEIWRMYTHGGNMAYMCQFLPQQLSVFWVYVFQCIVGCLYYGVCVTYALLPTILIQHLQWLVLVFVLLSVILRMWYMPHITDF